MIPIYAPGDLQREPYCSTPIRDLLFRNFTLTFYMRPDFGAWWQWYVMDDFGNLTRVDTSGARYFKQQGDH